MSYNLPTVSRMPHQRDSMSADAASTTSSTRKSSTSAAHQRFVLTDHVAFRYLEEDPSTTVLARRQQLQGYEVYLVEQWACSRTHPTCIITTYTGDPQDKIFASVLSVPTDEQAWSPQLKVYFKALDQYHARRKETELGMLMITNLSSFPSSLTVIPVPEGDTRKYRELFFVNENLKRLGCSGRLGIKLAPPGSATKAKFHQLYRTSDKIPFYSSVIELVKLCQVALVMFGKLEPEYADGLLCDLTEKAINDWWVEFGVEHYNIEPHDGILGPTTVAALLGMLMGARNRLNAYNAPVAKDVFDIDSTKRGIAYFQKSQRIQKTRRLDRQTLERLRRATIKAASKEGWTMPRALKSTVAELGGKGGEMVMDMVGAGAKAGIADIETVDIDRFIDLVYGERPKWLWYGKPRKTHTGDMFSRLPGEGLNSSDEHASTTSRLLKRESTLEGHAITKRETHTEDRKKRVLDGYGMMEDEKEKDPNSKRAVIKRATDKIESGSGFSRIKDAVGLRGHQSKHSREDSGRIPLEHTKSDTGLPQSLDVNGTPVEHNHGRPKLDRNLATEAAIHLSAGRSDTDYEPSFIKTLTETPRDSASTLAVPTDSTMHTRPQGKREQSDLRTLSESEEELSKLPTADDSIAGSVYHGIDLAEILPLDEIHETPAVLRRTQSSDQLGQYHASRRNDEWWPRHLSFSIAEESILTWPSVIAPPDEVDDADSSPRAAVAKHLLLTEEAKRLNSRLAQLRAVDATWVEHRITSISELDAQADQDIRELEDMYYLRFDEYQALREEAREIVSRERLELLESVRDLETLGAKLEYEIHTLRGKVDDVEDGVAELERQVENVEDRVRELEEICGEKEGWVHWLFRISTGIGKPPS